MQTELLQALSQRTQSEFQNSQRILSFREYLAFFAQNSNAEHQVRASAHYIIDMMDHFGRDPATGRFKLFDLPVEGYAPKVAGHEDVQAQIYEAFKGFARQGLNSRLLLLHGPNGSAKSTLIRALMGGMERYSQENAGAVYTFNWIFPHEKATRAEIGVAAHATRSEPDTYAKLSDSEISAKLPCEMKDHPFLLIPKSQRFEVLVQLFDKPRAEKIWSKMSGDLKRGDLCHRCKQIFEALLTAHQGDLQTVLRHIQVERFYYSRRYRRGLVTVEPQLHVDASASQVTLNRSISALPSILQNLNLFTYAGDLIDGVRGIVDYADLLKRPVDTFKYLLSACEMGSVNVGPTHVFLDVVMLGSSNELQMDAFKEFPDFSSFKARMELIRVPYLLKISQEAELYDRILKDMEIEKHIAPHVARTLALWAILTRLKKPNSINYPPAVSPIIAKLSPLEKAKLYDNGEMPVALSPEERQTLRNHLPKLREEYSGIPYYEGRMGASPREMKTVIADAIQAADFKCVSPLAVLREIEELAKKTSEYEFLRQEIKDGYHDAHDFIRVVRKEYLETIDREVRDCIGLYDAAQWEDFLKKYVIQVSHLLKKEKIKNPITGKAESPDEALIQELEKIVEAPKDSKALESFRQDMMTRVGAWKLDHPNDPMTYSQVFPEYWTKLEKHYYDGQKQLLKSMNEALRAYDVDKTRTLDTQTEGYKLALQTLTNLKKSKGYCDHCAKEVIDFLMRERF